MENNILELFPAEDRPLWQKVAEKAGKLQEIRLRVGQPVMVYMNGREYFLTKDGRLSLVLQDAYRAGRAEIQRLLVHNCEASPYAFEAEIKQGFLPVKGGHRIGITGQAVLDDRGHVKILKNISGINLRISHEIFGAGRELLPLLFEEGNFKSTLLIGPPGSGKTTLLRDLIRYISDGNPYCPGMNVGVVDERGEIGGCYMGVPRNDLGIRTDILDACPKTEGLLQLIRGMAPAVIAVDEIGKEEDMQALRYAVTCGVKILATVHGNGSEDLLQKEKNYLKCGKHPFAETFEYFVILEKKNGNCVVAAHYGREEFYAQTDRDFAGNTGMFGSGNMV
ncbi:MAG: stage III sporulation protein AA [Lachnospiraceae bacterium]|nr:stage III sporulation protein AA [Lachnospiraceae bacterium]